MVMKASLCMQGVEATQGEGKMKLGKAEDTIEAVVVKRLGGGCEVWKKRKG